MKKDAFYFAHDYNASNDIKCLFLRQALGMEGYGIYWFLVESLANAGGFLPLSITPVLAMQMQVTEIKVQSVINNFNLFLIDENQFFSKRLIEHLEMRKALSDSGKRGAINRWNKSEDSHPISLPIGHPIGGGNAKERKGKEIKLKEKEIKNKGIEFDFVLPEFLDCFKKWLKYKKDRKESYKNEDSIKAAYNKLLKLSDNSPVMAVEIIEQSMANNWAGLFELKETQKNKANAKDFATDEFWGERGSNFPAR